MTLSISGIISVGDTINGRARVTGSTILTGYNESIRQKNVFQMPVYPENSHRLTWDCTRTSTVKDRRLAPQSRHGQITHFEGHVLEMRSIDSHSLERHTGYWIYSVKTAVTLHSQSFVSPNRFNRARSYTLLYTSRAEAVH
jgi:hypothetical protein